MTRDPFLRLALLALATAYAVGVVALGRWLGFAALGVVVGALVIAVGMTVQSDPSEEPRPSRGRTRRFGGPRPTDSAEDWE